MSGNSDSSDDFVTEKWKEAEGELEMFMAGIFQQDVDRIINISAEELRCIDAETCGEHAYMLQRYALFLQEESNKLSAEKYWAKQKLDIVIGKYAKSYGDKYTSFEERRTMLIANNTYAYELNNKITVASMKLERLAFMAGKVSKVASTLIDIQRTRSNTQWNH